MLKGIRLLYLLATCLIVSCASEPTPRACAANNAASLRDAAQGCSLSIGAAVDAKSLRSDAMYKQTLSREFNAVTPENAMKWATVHPTRDKYDFTDADAIVDFATENKMLVHGHTLVWHNSLPTWVSAGSFSRDELIAILRDHITTVVGRYRGRVAAWDVVNEALNDDGSPRQSIWASRIGPDYIEMAFRWAHEADPQAKLFYNEDKAESMETKSNAVYNLVKNLKSRGVPIDGVGLQSHVTTDSAPKLQDVTSNMNRFAELGLEVDITEMEVRLKLPSSPEDLNAQARVYRDMLTACLSVKQCKVFVMWGFTDKYSSVPSIFPGNGAALIYNESYQPKPAYKALADLMNRR